MTTLKPLLKQVESGKTKISKPTHVDRPRELQGSTWRIPFDGANLYVTVNHDGESVLEVFATGPISEGVGLARFENAARRIRRQRSRAQFE